MEWLGYTGVGAILTGLIGLVGIAIQKRRTTPERKLDALDGFQKLVQDLQEERDKADGRASDARAETVAERAVVKILESRLRVALAFIEVLRAWIIRGEDPPPPDYPEGLL